MQIIDNSMQSASATEQQSFISFITFAVIALEIYFAVCFIFYMC